MTNEGALGEQPIRSSACGARCYIGPSDLEADDEDTQDGDSLSHLKLDVSLTELSIAPRSGAGQQDLARELEQTRADLKQLAAQLVEARREISLLKAERDFLREQNLGLRNSHQAAANVPK